MKNEKYRRIIFRFIIAIISILITFSFADSSLAFEFIGWGIGATGYELGYYEAEKREEPMFLYFQLEKNEFCERLENDYFDDIKIYDFFKKYSKVVINLEGDIFEKDLADKYEVKDDPAFFIIFPFLEIEPQGVSPFLEDHEMTAEEFIQNIKNIFILVYNNKAHNYFEDGDYKNAMKFFEIAQDYDPKRAYSYYAIGAVYHSMAIDENKKQTLLKAEQYYLKALKIDPDYKECKEELEKLRNDKDKIGR